VVSSVSFDGIVVDRYRLRIIVVCETVCDKRWGCFSFPADLPHEKTREKNSKKKGLRE